MMRFFALFLLVAATLYPAHISHTHGKDHPHLFDHLSDLAHRQYLVDIGSSRCQKFDQTGCVPLSHECEKCGLAQEQDVSTKPYNSAFWYGSAGVLLILPQVGVGYRWQNGVVGGDISLDATYGFALAGAQLIRFIKPKDRSLYIGAGLGISYVYLGELGAGWIFFVQGSLGYKFLKKQFIELKPLVAVGPGYAVPGAMLKYGFGF